MNTHASKDDVMSDDQGEIILGTIVNENGKKFFQPKRGLGARRKFAEIGRLGRLDEIRR